MSVSNFIKFDVKLDTLLAGYSTVSCKPGEFVWIIQKEFVSSEDGDLLISRMEGFPSLLLNKIAQIHQTIIIQSSIDNMLALLKKDKSATIYINAPMRALMQVKKSVDFKPEEAGEEPFGDHAVNCSITRFTLLESG